MDSLQNEDVFLYNTDTVWGIGADATVGNNYTRIARIKKRNINQTFIILMKDLDMLHRYVSSVDRRLEQLLTHSQKPTTVLIPNMKYLPRQSIPPNSNYTAIRIPKNKLCQDIMSVLGVPIISTSANLNGCPTPSKFDNIDPSIKSKVDHVFGVDHVTNSTNISSSIVMIKNNTIKHIR